MIALYDRRDCPPGRMVGWVYERVRKESKCTMIVPLDPCGFSGVVPVGRRGGWPGSGKSAGISAIIAAVFDDREYSRHSWRSRRCPGRSPRSMRRGRPGQWAACSAIRWDLGTWTPPLTGRSSGPWPEFPQSERLRADHRPLSDHFGPFRSRFPAFFRQAGTVRVSHHRHRPRL